MLNKFQNCRSVCSLLVCSIILSSCSGALFTPKSRNYIFTYSLAEPVKSNTLIFRDKYLIIQFAIDESAVSFQMQNISEAPMTIIWNDVSIGVNKRTFSVRNTNTFYSLTNTPFADVTIPPLGYVRDIVIPRENIFVLDGKWVERQFFLTNDRGSKRMRGYIQRYVGSEISLTIPIKIGEVVIKYPFVFKVSKVTELPPNLLPPVRQRPPMPEVPSQTAGSGQQIMPVVIAAVVLGLTAYILSKKKTPAGDI